METSIFAQPLIRGLTDKIYDRRKAAALEIEKLVRENENTPERITEIIMLLSKILFIQIILTLDMVV
ncbi:unnamed protein product [Cunninghamella echinulata]